jgi:hypothetical protein
MFGFLMDSELLQQRCVTCLSCSLVMNLFVRSTFSEILRALDILLGLPRLDDEQATLKYGVDRFLY